MRRSAGALRGEGGQAKLHVDGADNRAQSSCLVPASASLSPKYGFVASMDRKHRGDILGTRDRAIGTLTHPDVNLKRRVCVCQMLRIP